MHVAPPRICCPESGRVGPPLARCRRDNALHGRRKRRFVGRNSVLYILLLLGVGDPGDSPLLRQKNEYRGEGLGMGKGLRLASLPHEGETEREGALCPVQRLWIEGLL